MSKLLTGLMEAERKRRQRAANGKLPATFGTELAGPVVRGEADPELAADVEAEEALARRIEEEALALATARRNERRAAHLAAAAAARAANDANLARLAQERATAERRAADRAAAQLQAERAAEASAAARVEAETDALQQGLRRAEIEAEVRRLGLAQPGTEPAQRLVLEAVAPAWGRREPLPRGRLLAALALAMAIGAAAGLWLGRPARVAPPVGASDSPVNALARMDSAAADPDAPFLRLDHELRAVSHATPRSLAGDP